jgi:glycolate oxidase FAD binding subunit
MPALRNVMIDDDAIIQRLQAAIGSSCVLTGEAARPYGTDGFTPFVTAAPEDRSQAAEVVRIAAEERVGIIPRGGGSKLSWEPVPGGMVMCLSTERLKRVVQHEPRDLTVTVEAGVVLADLNDLLKRHNQRLSIDPPHALRATVGGICATNDSGPLRQRYGTLRDLVVGMEVINSDGKPTRSGGRVVKNAAGYGMHRLHIGAFGSWGLMTEMAFRLASLLAGRTRPAILELVRPLGDDELTKSIGEGDWPLVVGYEDCREAVEWQCDHLGESLSVPVRVLDEPASQALYQAICEWPGRSAAVSFKAAMKSSHVAPFLAWAGERGFRLLSHAASGVVYGRSDDPATVEAADDLAAAAADGAGQIAWRSLPPGANVEVWQPPRGDLTPMKRIKQALDPAGIFSPGRWVDAME